MGKRRGAALKRELVKSVRVELPDIGLIRKLPVAPLHRAKLMAIAKEIKAIDRKRRSLRGRNERMVDALERLPVENRLIEVRRIYEWDRGGR